MYTSTLSKSEHIFSLYLRTVLPRSWLRRRRKRTLDVKPELYGARCVPVLQMSVFVGCFAEVPCPCVEKVEREITAPCNGRTEKIEKK